MKNLVSILVPVLNEEENLPSLLRALAVLLKKSPAELLFIDNGSEDGSVKLLENFCRAHPEARLLFESKKGFAEPLNRGLAEAKGDFLLFLDADAVPAANWIEKMRLALVDTDIAVGNTLSILSARATPYGKLALELFKNHSESAAHAHGHALPWGPTCNLGVKRSVFNKVDLFSPEAAGAFDIDWCWRALLQGLKLSYARDAKVNHVRRNDRDALLRQFDRYGRSEAWIHKTYAFLTSSGQEETDPLFASVDAFHRLRMRVKKPIGLPALQALNEISVAFSSGVRAGHSGFYRPCSLKRPRPTKAVSWANSAGGVTVFVSGKGVTEFAGKGLQAWQAYCAGATDAELAKLMTKLFKVPAKNALSEAREFKKALQV